MSTNISLLMHRSQFLLGLTLSAALFACKTDQALEQQIRLEKSYFRAQKIAEAISINPRIAPIQDFAQAAALFRRVVDEVDTTSTNPQTIDLVKRSLMKIAELEMLQQHVDKAVEVYQEILKRFYADDDDVTVAARLALGLLHARSFQYQDAIDAYAGLLPNFSAYITPAKPNAYLMSIPFQFARLNQMSQYGVHSQNAYSQATGIYQQIIAQWPNTKAATIATNYLAMLLADQTRWEELDGLLNQKIANQQDTASRAEYLYWKGLVLHNRRGKPAEAMQIFQDFLAHYPNHTLIPQVRLEVAKITLEQGEDEEARELLMTIVREHNKVPEIAARAREEIARSYEADGRWDLAVNEYRFLAKEYETTPPGLAAMFYIARYYTEHHEPQLAETAYQEAISFYQELIRKYPQSLVAAIAQEQIANCFLTQKKWDKAVAAASNISKILDNSVGRISTYLLLGNIYEFTGQPKLAVKAYQEFLTQFPQHPLAGTLKEKVQRLMNS
jgi:tetratricopeptide (TPR) repeat protein